MSTPRVVLAWVKILIFFLRAKRESRLRDQKIDFFAREKSNLGSSRCFI